MQDLEGDLGLILGVDGEFADGVAEMPEGLAGKRPTLPGLQNHQHPGVIRKAFEAESGEMNEARPRETLAREGMVYASWLITLAGSFEGIGLCAAWGLVPKVTPAKVVDPFDELRAPDMILFRVRVEVADHEGATASITSHPYAELFERLSFHVLGRHVDGRYQDSVDRAPRPVVLELATLLAEALVGLQFPFTIEPDVALAAMKGGP